MRERLAREAAKEPTVIGTDKPEGQKKARRTMAGVSAKDKEIAEKEAALKSYLDALTKKKKIGITVVLMEGTKRTRAMQEAVDDDLKRSLHWISDEVDRLGVCWCDVSTKKGGVGSS